MEEVLVEMDRARPLDVVDRVYARLDRLHDSRRPFMSRVIDSLVLPPRLPRRRSSIMACPRPEASFIAV